jgi:uncharacterized protein (DUF2141 family)
MKGCTNWSLIIIAAVSAVFFNCARQMPPSGGPRDISPPVITRSVPLNGSLNFKGKNIIITFDEFVVLDKINEKFMISPPVNKKPEISLKGKSLNIQFAEKLKDSTTYTLYFQDAIRDLNEGNAILNFQFVFSTGSVLDSLSVTGNVYNASDLEITENTLILMYKQLADSAPVKLLPDYISLADINGGFRINNIKEGTYRLYALQDKNNNKKYDLADEGFAFMDDPVDINHIRNYLPVIKVKDTTKVNAPKTSNTKIKIAQKKPQEVPLIDGEFKLFLFTSAKKHHYLTSSSRNNPNLLSYTLSLPPDSLAFEFAIPDIDRKCYFIEKNITGDTIDVWLTDSLLYSKQQINTVVDYPFTDSTGITKPRIDTIPMRFTVTRATKNKEALSKYTFSSNLYGSSIRPGQQIIFKSQTPFNTPDTTKIRLYETGKAGNTSIPFSIIKDSLNTRRCFLKTKFKEGSTYLFIADSASFSNIFGDVADSAGMKFSVRMPDTYGRLTMNISNVTSEAIIQLLDTKEKIISEKHLKADGKVEFPFLEKGNYRLRVIYDLNGDGKWTTGDYHIQQQPEPVSYYSGEIEIKIDWEILQDWDINKQNQKDQKLKAKNNQNR